ncbi:carbon-nitrogen hydrolase family protein [Aliiroseovarius crassostreae]|uniref:carbon-nitrogen hydrolase family protein n=1 Tax=Aliiroseovarius crassostreae TaxID=154981 RepID=UPI00220D9225|nr:carbon-nitrogen hydrolase family protein [Aliiroseovarius crassostreae]UWP98399.1 carbon-nitrogen hydrolase family protein [Aliiroseovarius crassostreae]
MKIGLVQMTSGEDVGANLTSTRNALRAAAAGGAGFVLTPEVTNLLSSSRRTQEAQISHEEDCAFLHEIREEARALGIWVLLGSLAVKTHDPDGRFANRSFLISPLGQITARYDKIHMFDVEINAQESYRESAHYRPGEQAVLAETDFARIGMTICYDIRFPHLYRQLAQNGAEILTVPAAFSPVTGAAHWETLLRARAIETGCFVLAPAQCGQNTEKRATFGHSLVVAPWGEILADGGEKPGVTLVDIDLNEVKRARARVPSLTHDRKYEGP